MISKYCCDLNKMNQIEWLGFICNCFALVCSLPCASLLVLKIHVFDKNQFQQYLVIIAMVVLIVLKMASFKTFIQAPQLVQNSNLLVQSKSISKPNENDRHGHEKLLPATLTGIKKQKKKTKKKTN